MKTKLTQDEIGRVRQKYGNINSELGRAAGVTASIVLKLLCMSHGEDYTKEEFAKASYEERGLLQQIKNTIHREKLTAKQKVLFDFIAKETK